MFKPIATLIHWSVPQIPWLRWAGVIENIFSPHLTMTSCPTGKMQIWMFGALASRPGWVHAKVPAREDTIISYSQNLHRVWWANWLLTLIFCQSDNIWGLLGKKLLFRMSVSEVLHTADQLTEGKCFLSGSTQIARIHSSSMCWWCVFF